MFLYRIFFILNLFSVCFSYNKSDFKYVNFDPLNDNQYAQVLKLMEDNKIYLLDPDEDPKVALDEYKQALLGQPKKVLKGLQVKVLMTPDYNKVVGFISYISQSQNQKLPYLIRTIAVDVEFQRFGLGTLLLSNVEQEAKKNGHPQTCFAVYSFNDAMLSLGKKRLYDVYRAHRMSWYAENSITGKRDPIDVFIVCKELKKSGA